MLDLTTEPVFRKQRKPGEHDGITGCRFVFGLLPANAIATRNPHVCKVGYSRNGCLALPDDSERITRPPNLLWCSASNGRYQQLTDSRYRSLVTKIVQRRFNTLPGDEEPSSTDKI